MNRPEKYRQNAAECYDAARILSDPGEKAKMLARVQAWLMLADQAKRNSNLNLEPTPGAVHP